MTITLSTEQQNAADKFLDFLTNKQKSEFVLQGHSGTGKTTLTKYLIELAIKHKQVVNLVTNEEGDLDFGITATTNKAAKVLGNKIGEEARTIHSYLELNVYNDFKTGKTTLKKRRNFTVKEDTLLIIDEASMIDKILLNMINEATRSCKILYVGDPYQLAPVFEKTSPVFDMGYETVLLTQIQRQVAGNPIIQVADRLRDTVKNNTFFPIPSSDKIQHIDGATFKQLVDNNYKNQVDIDDNRILAWTNEKVVEYCDYVRNTFYTSSAPQPGEVLISNGVVKSKDGTIVTGNDQTVQVVVSNEAKFLGIDGYSVTLNCGSNVFVPKSYEEVKALIKHEQKQAKAGNKDWADYFQLKECVADFRSPFACTVHKSQGSTYKNVYIDLYDIGRCNKPNDVARMLYVAITRASDKVYLYGELPTKYQ